MEKQIRLTLPIQIQKRNETEGDSSEEMIVEGYAFKFDQETVLYKNANGYEYREVISKEAVTGMDISDVPFKYNHDDSVMIVARTRNKSLQLEVDDIGLKIRARFIDTQTGRDLYKMIKEGLVDKMSFAFTEKSYPDDEDRCYEHGPNYTRHTIRHFEKIWDVSAVDIPAYDQTEIYARSIASLENKARTALEKASELDLRKRKLILKNKLLILEDKN